MKLSVSPGSFVLLTILWGCSSMTAYAQAPIPVPLTPKVEHQPGLVSPGPPPSESTSPNTPPEFPLSNAPRPDSKELEVEATPRGAPAVTLQGADLKDAQINAVFCPGPDATVTCVREIAAAQKTVKVQTFQMLSLPIAQALQAAVKRGVLVTLLLDESNIRAYEAGAKYLLMPNVVIYGDARHPSLSGNLIIVDDKTIITGAYHFDRVSDDRSGTSLLILKNMPRLVNGYLQDFQIHRAHSRLYNLGAVNEVRPPLGAELPDDSPPVSLSNSKDRDSAASTYLSLLNAYAQRVATASQRSQPVPHGMNFIPFPQLLASQPWMEKFIGRSVEISFVVNKDGKANQFEVVTSTGSKQIDTLATELLSKMTFPDHVDQEGRHVVYGMNHVFTVMSGNGNPVIR